ncbi:MAG: hypothetical protein QXP70_05855 [Methanomassiliicoccales archaeon]
MTVKDKVGRRRYVAVIVSPPAFSRKALEFNLRRAANSLDVDMRRLRVVRAEGPLAIVSCSHLDREKLMPLLNGSIGIWQLHSILSSGTISTLSRRLSGMVATARNGGRRKD